MKPISNAEANLVVQKTVGERLRAARKGKGLTQSALAALCNLHVSHLSKVERGAANVTLSTLLKMATTLGIVLADLFKGVSDADDS